jgi:hypothetical protein
MKITSINILVGGIGMDHVYLHTDLPDAGFPWTSTLDLTFRTAHGTALTYVRENFSGIPVKMLDIVTGKEETPDNPARKERTNEGSAATVLERQETDGSRGQPR